MSIVIGRSALLYQERRESEFQMTMRGPGFVLALTENQIFALPLVPPLPLPEVLADTTGDPSSSGAPTQIWPSGNAGS